MRALALLMNELLKRDKKDYIFIFIWSSLGSKCSRFLFKLENIGYISETFKPNSDCESIICFPKETNYGSKIKS